MVLKRYHSHAALVVCLAYYGLSGCPLEARQQLNIGPYSFLTMCMIWIKHSVETSWNSL